MGLKRPILKSSKPMYPTYHQHSTPPLSDPNRSFPEIGRDCCYFCLLTGHFHMADDEPVDPKQYLEEGCKPKCAKPLLEYRACVKRIEGDESGHKHCTGQYFDYWSCVDNCVASKLFSKVK